MNIIFRRDGDDEVTDLRVVQIHVGEGPQHMLREQGISALKTLAYLTMRRGTRNYFRTLCRSRRTRTMQPNDEPARLVSQIVVYKRPKDPAMSECISESVIPRNFSSDSQYGRHS